jgi:hypothetical protein
MVEKAYHSFQRIRNTKLEACRDLFYTNVGVELERKVNKGKNLSSLFWELFSVPRNARAAMASWIIVFGQQFCGVKRDCIRVHSPLLSCQILLTTRRQYSTTIFVHGGYSRPQALLFSMALVSSIGFSLCPRSSPSTLLAAVSCSLSLSHSWPSRCSGRACRSS